MSLQEISRIMDEADFQINKLEQELEKDHATMNVLITANDPANATRIKFYESNIEDYKQKIIVWRKHAVKTLITEVAHMSERYIR